MKWSFGIIFNATTYLQTQISSITNQEGLDKSNYEIVMVGPLTEVSQKVLEDAVSSGVDIKLAKFDDTEEKGWITRKKNIFSHIAKNNNLVLTHDYIALCRGWYKNFVEYGEDWELCMNPIRFPDGRRFRDWVKFTQWWGAPEFLPYEDESNTLNMYVSGTYWCAKKDFMLKNPMNEALRWGQGEDLEWAHRCRHTWKYRMNKKSVVKILKEKIWKFSGEMDYAPHPDTDTNTQDTDLFTAEIQT